MHTITFVLLSMPNTQAKDKARAGIAWTTALTSSLGWASPKNIHRAAQVFYMEYCPYFKHLKKFFFFKLMEKICTELKDLQIHFPN